MTTPDLTPLSAALARERTYRLFGRLYLRGLSPSLLPLARALPGLADAVPADVDPDATAAEHHRLFRFNLFPHQSIFLDPAGLLGGVESDRVRQSYRQSGYIIDDDAGPDHVGYELDFLAFLCSVEREALEEGDIEASRRVRREQRHFLQDHLLLWLFPFVLAVRWQEHPFYIALADLTLELIYDHALSLGSEAALPEAREDSLPEPPPLLEESETGLKEIAAYLVTPSYAGLFLTRDAIGRLGQELDVPRGFGDRQQTLVNLLRSAAQYDAFPALIRALQEMAGEWTTAYERRQKQMPELAPFCRPWQARVEKTTRLLAEIRAKT